MCVCVCVCVCVRAHMHVHAHALKGDGCQGNFYFPWEEEEY